MKLKYKLDSKEKYNFKLFSKSNYIQNEVLNSSQIDLSRNSESYFLC